ncbi:MAG: ZIP family metal transporter [Promethearchaeota archaeon]
MENSLLIIGFLMIFFIGCFSLIGLFMISLKEKTLDNILFILVAFATGTILATALFDLIPESIQHLEELNLEGANFSETLPFGIIIFGFVVFFILERFIYWFHGHAHQKESEYVCYENLSTGGEMMFPKEKNIKSVAILNLLGDALHNFLDGIIIMVAFFNGLVNGIIVVLAVLFHELPQEIGDFGILLYGGFSRRNALFYNFMSAMVALLGGLISFILSNIIEVFNSLILAFSGGGFLYIASAELMPEIIKQKNLKKSIIQALIFLVGILLIISLVLLLPHE